MLNKYAPFFIVIIFIVIGCHSSFPVTFHGVSFKDYVKGKHKLKLDSSYVSTNHLVQIYWQLVAFDDSRNEYMNGYNLRELNLMLRLTNKEYVPEYWKFNFPLYCNGKGVTNSFTASYIYDNTGNIRFSNLSPKQLV